MSLMLHVVKALQANSYFGVPAQSYEYALLTFLDRT